MDIHKPHAPHSLGEFAREIATIVTGILIALALEQGVTWLHERHVAAEALASVRTEIAHDVGVEQAEQRRIPCISQRLSEVSRILDDPQASLDPVRAPIWIGPSPIGDMPRARFDAANSAGRLVLLTPEDQRKIADFYTNFVEFDVMERQQSAAFAQLRSLTTMRGPVSDADRARLRGALQEARQSTFIMLLDAENFGKAARSWGLQPDNVPMGRLGNLAYSVCVPLRTSPEKAAALIKSHFGLPD